MRLEKFLSESGIASRRDAKKYIAAGRVSVNGERVLIPGTHIAPQQDEIIFDGEPIRGKPKRIYLMLNKPAGYVTTVRDERGPSDSNGVGGGYTGTHLSGRPVGS